MSVPFGEAMCMPRFVRLARRCMALHDRKRVVLVTPSAAVYAKPPTTLLAFAVTRASRAVLEHLLHGSTLHCMSWHVMSSAFRGAVPLSYARHCHQRLNMSSIRYHCVRLVGLGSGRARLLSHNKADRARLQRRQNIQYSTSFSCALRWLSGLCCDTPIHHLLSPQGGRYVVTCRGT